MLALRLHALQEALLAPGLPIFDRAAREILGEASDVPVLREVSGERDHVLSLMLEQFRIELTSRHQPSALFVQGIAQSLAVHLVRHYRDPETKSVKRRSALPASNCGRSRSSWKNSSAKTSISPGSRRWPV